MRLSRFSSERLAVLVIGLGTVIGPGHAIAQRAVGIDVSSYQGSADNPPTTINWSSVKAAGIQFAWAKATQSTGYTDADFSYNVTQAKAAGVLIGAYHFANPNINTGTAGADAEAAHFWNVAGSYITAGGAYLMPMLDYETAPGGTQAASAAWINEWCNDIKNDAAVSGAIAKPVIYTDGSIASDWMTSANTQWALWMASPNGENPQTGAPNEISPWSTWTIWQYGGGAVSGIENDVDEDVFNGTFAAMTNALTIVTGNPIAPAGATLYWDPGAKKASPGSGGTGNWDLSTDSWWYTGSSNWVWSPNGDTPIFAGTAGTVTLNASLSAGNLTFDTAGYTIAGTGNTLTFTNNSAIISVPPPGSSPVNIDCILTGSGYTVTGGGVLVLNNTADSVTSPINIVSNTTLVIASSKAIGTGSGTVTISGGGSLQNNDATSGDAFLNSSFDIVLGTGGGYLNDNINASLTYGGVISGSGNLTKIGGGGGTGGTLTLTGANTYSGSTTISQGVLALGSAGSINDSPTIFIDAGGALDVSAIANWTLGSSAVLKASGTGTAVGSTAATIKAASANGASLGSQPITLFFAPTATNGDTAHPALYVSQGTLTLSHGNTVTISNASSATLGVGIYTLIQQASGSISGAPYPTAFYSSGGAGVAAGTKSSLSVSGGAMYLTIARDTTTTLSALTASTYGQSVTFTATVAPAPAGGTVQFYDNNVALGGALNLTDGTASYSSSTLAVGSHPITAVYSGSTFYSASTNSGSPVQQVNAAALTITAGPQSKTYGQTMAFGAGNTNFASSGLQNGNTIGSVTLAVTGNGGAANAPVGTYIITPSAAAGGTFTPGNYSITYKTGLLTVNQATATVTASPQTKTYGQTLAVGSGSLLFTSSTLSNSETIGSVTLAVIGGGDAATAPVGSYIITPSAATGGSGTEANYNIIYNTGLLTVNPLTVTLTGTRNYDGTTNAVFGVLSVSNIIGSDNVTLASGSAGLASEDIGTNVITSLGTLALGGTAATNYTLTGASGSVTVTPLPVTVTGARPYDGTTTALAAILAIATNFDGTNLTLAGSATLAAADVGLENIADFSDLALGGTASTNYTMAGASGAVTISAAPLTVTADDQSKTYGQMVAFGSGSTNFTSSGLQNGDLIESVTLAASGNSGAPGAPVGTYMIIPSAAMGGTFTASDYSITYDPGTLTVMLPPNTIPVTINGVTLLSNGTVQMNFTGTPGYVYMIEAATNLTPPITWTILSTNAADTNGVFSFTDLGAPNYSGRYYQTVAQ